MEERGQSDHEVRPKVSAIPKFQNPSGLGLGRAREDARGSM